MAARTRRWETRAAGKMTVQLPAGESRHEVKLSTALDGGPLALEIHAPRRGRQGAGLRVGRRGGRVAGHPPRDRRTAHQRADKPGRCEVEVSGKLGRRAVGRRGAGPLRAAGASASPATSGWRAGRSARSSRWKSLRPLCVYHEIVARVFGAESDRSGCSRKPPPICSCCRPSRRTPIATCSGVWGAPERDVLLIQAGLDTTHAVGLTLHSHCYDDRLLYATGGFKTAAVNLQRAATLRAARASR